MSKINTLGFTATASLYRSSIEHRLALSRAVIDNQNAVVLPQQSQYECCQEAYGSCTGFWGTSEANLAGYGQKCWRGFQYAWVRVCRDIDSGAITAESHGCGTCAW